MGMRLTCPVLMGVLIVARLHVYLCGVMDCNVVSLAQHRVKVPGPSPGKFC